MGNLLTREMKRDFIHLSEHSDFKTALRATGDLLDTYAKAEKLRLEQKKQRMKEREEAMQRGQGRQHNRQREEADPLEMGRKDRGYGPPPRRQEGRNTRRERPPHCATLGKPRVSSALTCLQRDNLGRGRVQCKTNLLRPNTAGSVTPMHIHIQNLRCTTKQSIPTCKVPTITLALAIVSEYQA